MESKEKDDVKKLVDIIQPAREKLLKHPLYSGINSAKDVKIFMESHVYAVWDFMSLLKALQIRLTSTVVPWTPKGNPISRRLINEIVLAEESDVNERNETVSHFEMYVDAMNKAGADVTDINKFCNKISLGSTYHEAAKDISLNKDIKEFIDFTFDVISTNKKHIIAAVFTFGREDLIPDMFIEIVKNLQRSSDTNFGKFIYYLERHIELDGDEHGPMALQMMNELCGEDKIKWKEAADYSILALEHRYKLWTAIHEQLVIEEEVLELVY